MSREVLARLAALVVVGAQIPEMGGRTENMKLSDDDKSAMIHLVINDVGYLVTIEELPEPAKAS